jgi:hypothetical protein
MPHVFGASEFFKNEKTSITQKNHHLQMFFANDTISLSAAEATPKAVNYLCWKSKMVGPKLRELGLSYPGSCDPCGRGPGPKTEVLVKNTHV